jgi:integrating conjugative element protein (TIGR03757 family)
MANYHWNSLKSWYAALSVVAVFGGVVKVQAGDGENPVIEIFVANAEPGVSESEYTTVYKVGRIAQLQKELSIDLPADSKSAKALALQRFQRMNTQLSIELENAAKGLVQAMQYGIDRYPAIVFDGQAVVYGLTDIPAATQLYQRWQAESATQ